MNCLKTLVLVLAVAASGCRTRLYELTTDASVDLAEVPDLAVAVPDLWSPTHLNCYNIFTVDSDKRFAAFDPMKREFVDIGFLDCPTGVQGESPFSMAVDRMGSAWVLFNQGEIFRVDITNAICHVSAIAAYQQGFTTFGMGFVADPQNPALETLYLASGNPMVGLGILDLPTRKVHEVAPLDGNPELTGTGDGKLWGFFPVNPPTKVAQIDTLTGQLGRTLLLPTLDSGKAVTAWAFAWFAGDFWLFLERDGDLSTTVYRLDATTGVLETAIPNTGRHIVGAGVSTCAPINPQ